MENHPIPQDVTGFQFKLIGNMTVKQFAYLASGSILAVILYYAPVFILLKLILIPLFAGTGAALAFLPIEGRPMDLMIGNFIKDLFSPTQYIYQKTGGQLAISLIDIQAPKAAEPKTDKKHRDLLQHEREIKLQEFISHLSKRSKTELDEKEEMFMNAIFGGPQLLSAIADSNSSGHQLSEEEALRVKMAQSPDDMEHELEKEAEAIKQELAQAMAEERQLEANHQNTAPAAQHVNDLESQLQAIMQQKLQLEQELEKLKSQRESVQQQPPSQEATQPLKESQNIRIVPTDKASTVGLPSVPDVPNIVLGIVKDPRGNILPNILVEIKDKDGNPVRAFKTNGLGQFASATPLMSGSYTIEFEDPKGNQKFETVAIEAKGEIMYPLEIISHDAREELRKELFS